MKFINNPFEILTEVIQENFPHIDCDIHIGEQMTDGKETFGCTLFPDDEKERIVIELHTSLSLKDATEILAHELAHVIAGKDAGHKGDWVSAFDDIHFMFHQKLEEKYTKK